MVESPARNPAIHINLKSRKKNITGYCPITYTIRILCNCVSCESISLCSNYANTILKIRLLIKLMLYHTKPLKYLAYHLLVHIPYMESCIACSTRPMMMVSLCPKQLISAERISVCAITEVTHSAAMKTATWLREKLTTCLR